MLEDKPVSDNHHNKLLCVYVRECTAVKTLRINFLPVVLAQQQLYDYQLYSD